MSTVSRSSILAPSSSPPRSPLTDVTGGAEKSCSPRSSPASRSRSASARPSARNTTTTFTTRRLAASLAPPWRRGGFSGSTRKRSHGRSAMRARWPSAFGSSTRKVRCRNTFTRDTPPRAGFAPRSSPRMVSRAPARSWKASAGSSLGWLRKASRTKSPRDSARRLWRFRACRSSPTRPADIRTRRSMPRWRSVKSSTVTRWSVGRSPCTRPRPTFVTTQVPRPRTKRSSACNIVWRRRSADARWGSTISAPPATSRTRWPLSWMPI